MESTALMRRGLFRNRSLQTKLYICILVFIILPLMAAGLILNANFSQVSLKNTIEAERQKLLQTKKNIEFMVAEIEDLSVRIISNDSIQQLLKERDQDSPAYEWRYIEAMHWMNDVIGMRDAFYLVSISRDGSVLFQRGLFLASVNPDFERLAVDRQGTLVWSHPETNRAQTSVEHSLSFYRNIMDFNQYGHSLGVLKISVEGKKIDSVASVAGALPGEKHFLTDSQGVILASNDKQRIGENLLEHDFARNVFESEQGYFTAKAEGAASVVMHMTIERTNWKFIRVIPVQAITGTNQINMMLLISIAFCILFGMLFSYVQHRYQIKPLLRLLKDMSRLKRGDFDIAFRSESADEIGEISRAFYQMSQELKKTIDTVYISKIKQREAELTALEAQINPHFLYNTLDSIRWLAVKERNYKVGEQIEALSEMFRHVLNKGQQLVTVRQELNFVRNYMQIQEAKYGDRIRLSIQADESLYSCKCPKLILQPLVENACIHGLEHIEKGGVIEVAVERDPVGLQFTVSDNGAGTDEDAIREMLANQSQTRRGYALKNIDERIKLLYGEPYGLSFSSAKSRGTKVVVKLPLIP